jgi:hypothetical protein
MRRNHFSFIEMIGSVVLVLLDPVRKNNKRYLNQKYNHLNRVVGIVTLLILLVTLLYFSIIYINKNEQTNKNPHSINRIFISCNY